MKTVFYGLYKYIQLVLSELDILQKVNNGCAQQVKLFVTCPESFQLVKKKIIFLWCISRDFVSIQKSSCNIVMDRDTVMKPLQHSCFH